jgi:hypothetical protein
MQDLRGFLGVGKYRPLVSSNSGEPAPAWILANEEFEAKRRRRSSALE